MTVRTDSAADLLSKPRHLGQYGEANICTGKVTVTQGGSGDTLRFCIIPAGTEVSAVILANDDCDTNGSPSIAFKMGYTPVDGSNPAAVLDYFAATADATLQSANQGKVYASFDVIKFEYDVYLDITLSAAAATLATTPVVRVRVLGRNVGVK